VRLGEHLTGGQKVPGSIFAWPNKALNISGR
jgi:hypothetical protein